jgi:hypothetical protein
MHNLAKWAHEPSAAVAASTVEGILQLVRGSLVELLMDHAATNDVNRGSQSCLFSNQVNISWVYAQ